MKKRNLICSTLFLCCFALIGLTGCKKNPEGEGSEQDSTPTQQETGGNTETETGDNTPVECSKITDLKKCDKAKGCKSLKAGAAERCVKKNPKIKTCSDLKELCQFNGQGAEKPYLPGVSCMKAGGICHTLKAKCSDYEKNYCAQMFNLDGTACEKAGDNCQEKAGAKKPCVSATTPEMCNGAPYNKYCTFYEGRAKTVPGKCLNNSVAKVDSCDQAGDNCGLKGFVKNNKLCVAAGDICYEQAAKCSDISGDGFETKCVVAKIIVGEKNCIKRAKYDGTSPKCFSADVKKECNELDATTECGYELVAGKKCEILDGGCHEKKDKCSDITVADDCSAKGILTGGGDCKWAKKKADENQGTCFDASLAMNAATCGAITLEDACDNALEYKDILAAASDPVTGNKGCTWDGATCVDAGKTCLSRKDKNICTTRDDGQGPGKTEDNVQCQWFDKNNMNDGAKGNGKCLPDSFANKANCKEIGNNSSACIASNDHQGMRTDQATTECGFHIDADSTKSRCFERADKCEDIKGAWNPDRSVVAGASIGKSTPLTPPEASSWCATTQGIVKGGKNCQWNQGNTESLVGLCIDVKTEAECSSLGDAAKCERSFGLIGKYCFHDGTNCIEQ
jgi:hypothetical protein